MKSQEMVRVILYNSIMGMIDGLPAHRINKDALAKALNVRVEDGELTTCMGRAKLNSTPVNVSASIIRGLGAGQRADGTNDLIAATSGHFFRVVDNTKTLINRHAGLGQIVSISAGVISATSAQFLTDLEVGDHIVISGDAVTYGGAITAVSGNNKALYSAAYTGASTSGAYHIVKTQADDKVRIRMFMNSWLIGGPSMPFCWWTPATSAFQYLGPISGTSGLTIAMSGGGSLDSAGVYKYKVCHEDALGVYGMGVSGTITVSGTNRAAEITLPTNYAHHTKWWRIYRTEGGGSQFLYLTKIAVSAGTTYVDSTADGSLGTEEAPTENYAPASGADDFVIHKDRLITQHGSRIRIGGLSVYDVHSSDPPGRWQPWYDPGRRMYLGRDSGAQKDGRGLFVLRGRLYGLQSDSLWLIRSENEEPDAWEAVLMNPNVGCESQWSIWVDGLFAYWLAKIGGETVIVQFDGVNVVPMRQLDGTLETIVDAAATVGGGGGGYYRMSISASTNYELEQSLDNVVGQGTWCLRDWVHTCYAESVSATFGGGSDGFIYVLEKTFNNAGAAQSYEIQYPKIKDDGETPLWEYPKLWTFMQQEVECISAISALCAFYSVDGGSYNGLSAAGYPMSGANGSVLFSRMRLPTKAQGRTIQIKVAISGTNVKAKFRGLVLKGKPDIRESI